ncbi:MAG: HlyD family efflux transporter periplasmic adaptor subunit [Magnetococcales bacterium]|nr:HlyD family efflux transporter periplasmic adaptor subunit [Magnetococcales bacterium]
MSQVETPQNADPLMTLLQLEQEAREADGTAAFRYMSVNRTRLLRPYSQALFLEGPDWAHVKITAASDIPVPDSTAPMTQWVHGLVRRGFDEEKLNSLHTVCAADLDAPWSKEWAEWLPEQGLWMPLSLTDRAGPVAALFCLRREPFIDAEMALMERIMAAYGHAWRALGPVAGGRFSLSIVRNSWLRWTFLIIALLAMVVPVPQSVLAPAEVVAREPQVVAAPMDGVIDRFLVQPNALVETGTPLFTYVAEDFESRFHMAEQALAVAEAQLRRAQQGAFRQMESKAELALLESQARLKALERDHVGIQLDRVTVKAEQAGIAVFRDVNDWEGRPVKTGERIMLLADAGRVEISMDIPVEDAVALEEDAPVRLFLDVSPLHPLDATLRHASYQAAMTPEGGLAYRAVADLVTADLEKQPRIGLRGVARVHGGDVPLAFYLFRRPLTAVRRWLGW